MEDKSNIDLDYSFSSILDGITDDIIGEVENEVDIITFCEDSYYLGAKLRPVQKLILKVYYGLPLDNTEKTIQLRFYPYDKEGKYVTELEYVHFLQQQGRTNILDTEHYESSIELILVCGRRSGKSFLSSVISAYEAYKLILKGDPQKYYELTTGKIIRIVNLATCDEQAEEVAQTTQQLILNSQWFIPYVEGKNSSQIRLRTKRDLELIKQEKEIHGKLLDPHSSIHVESLSCSARGGRGGTVMVLILDELAHFVDNKGNRSGDTIYSAMTPSIATFGLDGKILCVSSPWYKGGIFYDLFLDSKGLLNSKNVTDEEKEQGIRDKLMFQLPTWEMNDKITFNFLDSEKRRNPEEFPTEFGAEFSSTILGFFKYPEKIDTCIVRQNEITTAKRGTRYYIAVDPASSKNGYALAMVHVERKEKVRVEGDQEVKVTVPVVVLDRWKVWTIDDPEFNGCDYIDEEVVEEYLNGLLAQYIIGKIVYDQYESTIAVVKLKKRGFNAEKTPFTRPYNMKIYSKLRSLVYENQIELFNHELGISELKALQEKRVGKRQFIVEAPTQGECTSDDLADVIANASYVALESEVEGTTPSIVGTTGGGTSYRSSGQQTNKTSYLSYKRHLRNNKTVSNLERATRMGMVRK